MRFSRSVAQRGVAVFEALKGVVVLLVAGDLLRHGPAFVANLATELVAHTHLNPASKYPHIFLDAAHAVNRADLRWLAAGAAVYGALRLAEGYGLFTHKRWAEWLAAVSGAVYVPVEAYGLVRQPSLLGAALFVLNLAVVAFMVQTLRRRTPDAKLASA